MQGVFYVDGSSKPNPGPGFSGFGVHGYHCEETIKKINPRHPIFNHLFYTTEGYSKEKPLTFVDVKTIVEVSVAVDGESESNNFAELLAFKWVLTQYVDKHEIEKITVLTDSTYVQSCFKDMLNGWADNGWLRTDGAQIAYKACWIEIYELSKKYLENNRPINVIWIKGHNDDYGNETADLYAAIGSTASKYQQNKEVSKKDFISLLFLKELTLKEYKDSFTFKDVIFNFKQLYFSNDREDDNLYCFLFNPPKKDIQSGKRTLESVFAINTGYVPDIVNKIKEYHRSLPRMYYGSACLNINTLSSNHKLRLFQWVPVEFLLTTNGRDNDVYIVKEEISIMCDVGNKLPLLTNLTKMYSNMTEVIDISSGMPERGYNTLDVDITALVVKDKKIAFNNQIKSLDITNVIQDCALKTRLISKVNLTIGADILNYLAMKQIEEFIESVIVKLAFNTSTNGVTCLVNFNLGNRCLTVSNISNKFLARS